MTVDPYTHAQEFIAENSNESIGRLLTDGRVLFRDITTGRFVEAEDFWAKFRDLVKEVGHS